MMIITLTHATNVCSTDHRRHDDCSSKNSAEDPLSMSVFEQSADLGSEVQAQEDGDVRCCAVWWCH